MASPARAPPTTPAHAPPPALPFQVVVDYVAMTSKGKVFDSSLEKGKPYDIRVGTGQVGSRGAPVSTWLPVTATRAMHDPRLPQSPPCVLVHPRRAPRHIEPMQRALLPVPHARSPLLSQQATSPPIQLPTSSPIRRSSPA